MVRYDGQQDASTNKVSTWSANQNMSHNPLGQLYTSQLKVNDQRKNSNKSQRSPVKVNVQPCFLCQKMWIEEFEVLGEFQVNLSKR